MKNFSVLWKSPVEKPVDTVEKCEISTAIPGIYNFEPLRTAPYKQMNI